MSEIDVDSRLEELNYYKQITKKLRSKFDDLLKTYECIKSQESTKVFVPLVASTERDVRTTCTECLSEFNHKISSFDKPSHEEAVQATHEQPKPICSTCLSKSDPNVFSPIWLLSRSEKLKLYENAISEGGHLTEPEMAISFNDGFASTSSNDDKRTFAEITKYKRDIKRKRMKYRTTKAPPLTHTEEIRGLISLQMELWEDFVATKPTNVKR